MNAFEERLNLEEKIKLLYTMLLSRHFEEKVNELFMQGKIHGTTHLGIGQEANHAGVSAALKPDDWILTTHRGHGHFIGKGGSVQSMMAELFGSKEGICYGLGGSMHLADLEHYNMGSSGVVGGVLPLAVGMGFALKYKEQSQIVLGMFGDAASNQGMALESFNLASVWEVPVLFYCENNMYGMSAPADKFVGGNNIPLRAESFGIKSKAVDGNNVIEVYNAVYEAAEYVRKNQKPFLIESKTYRWMGHSKSDIRSYRTTEEEVFWKNKCPIDSYKAYLKERDFITDDQIVALEKQSESEVEEAVSVCIQQDALSFEEMLDYVYCTDAGGYSS